MELPCNRIQKPYKAGFGDSPLEQGIRGQRTECVVTDLGIGWGTTTVNQRQIFIRWAGGDIQKC